MQKEVKVGDIVHVRGVVDRIGLIGVPVVRFPNGSVDHHGHLHVSEDIVHVETRPLQVGDVVTLGVGELKAEIVHIAGEQAWITGSTSSGVVFNYVKDISQLERV